MATKVESFSSYGEKISAEAINEIFPYDRFDKIRHKNIVDPVTNCCLEFDFYNDELGIANLKLKVLDR